MQTRRLGKSELELTPIGIGTWAIGGGEWEYGWGPQRENDSIEAILEGLELGLNWIDTAAAYGFGASEEAVGKAARLWGRPVIIATKCGILPAPGNRVNRYISKKTILKEAEDSLRRLKVDCIDLYQIHWPVPDENIEESFEALMQLKQEQRIRYAGVSNFSISQLERCLRIGEVTSLQPAYNILRREIEAEILPWCQSNGIGVITYSPIYCGLLTGKVSRSWAESLPLTDWRSPARGLPISQYLKEPGLTPFLGFIEKLQKIAAESGRSVAQLAIAWVLRRTEVTATIVGTRRKGQLAETVAAAAWQLTADELTAVEEALDEFQNELALVNK